MEETNNISHKKCIYACKLCNKRFNKEVKLVQRDQIHSGKGQRQGTRYTRSKSVYLCNVCQLTFKTKDDYENHMNGTHCCNVYRLRGSTTTTHSDGSKSKSRTLKSLRKATSAQNSKLDFRCSECTTQFASRVDLLRHMMDIHGIKLTRQHLTREKVTKFKSIKKVALTSSVSRRILSTRNLPNSRSAPKTVANISPTPKTSKLSKNSKLSYSDNITRHGNINGSPQNIDSTRNVFDCKVCGSEWINISQLRDHMICHSNERPFKCDTCSKTFKSARMLCQHMICHSNEKSFECPACFRRFKHDRNRRSHICPMKNKHSSKTGTSGHECKFCGSMWKSESDLRKHMNSHVDEERPYKCEMCFKAFIWMKNRRRHIQKCHSNEKTFKCDHCSRTFFNCKVNQRQHMRICQSDEKAYKCDRCTRTFNRKSHERRHMQICHSDKKPFKCIKCTKTFNWKSHKLLHIKHQYHCQLCKNTYCQFQSFRAHQRQHLSDDSKNDDECTGHSSTYKLQSHTQRRRQITDNEPSTDSSTPVFAHENDANNNVMKNIRKPDSSRDKVTAIDKTGFAKRKRRKISTMIDTKSLVSDTQEFVCSLCPSIFLTCSELAQHRTNEHSAFGYGRLRHRGSTRYKQKLEERDQSSDNDNVNLLISATASNDDKIVQVCCPESIIPIPQASASEPLPTTSFTESSTVEASTSVLNTNKPSTPAPCLGFQVEFFTAEAITDPELGPAVRTNGPIHNNSFVELCPEPICELKTVMVCSKCMDIFTTWDLLVSHHVASHDFQPTQPS